MKTTSPGFTKGIWSGVDPLKRKMATNAFKLIDESRQTSAAIRVTIRGTLPTHSRPASRGTVDSRDSLPVETASAGRSIAKGKGEREGHQQNRPPLTKGTGGAAA
ncbi:hypothetical protein PAPYR_5714 [Paratrimastix pyriformis]|uniref:Uncharacterized protein n=1 Tax=Paratrimastix pyriformis TaxID=342808 RepID=A0ABQ8UGY6_9EUKA|nr:hypothetical protein PAPYR_5714 [Paratrimastix pyriformis]